LPLQLNKQNEFRFVISYTELRPTLVSLLCV